MSKRNLGEKIKLSSYDDMFGTNEEEKKVMVVGDQIKDVALGELHPFKNHPFRVCQVKCVSSFLHLFPQLSAV